MLRYEALSFYSWISLKNIESMLSKLSNTERENWIPFNDQMLYLNWEMAFWIFFSYKYLNIYVLKKKRIIESVWNTRSLSERTKIICTKFKKKLIFLSFWIWKIIYIFESKIKSISVSFWKQIWMDSQKNKLKCTENFNGPNLEIRKRSPKKSGICVSCALQRWHLSR